MKRATLLLVGVLSTLLIIWVGTRVLDSTGVAESEHQGLTGARPPEEALQPNTGAGRVESAAESSAVAALQDDRQIVEAQDFDLDRALWLEGRVSFPADTPKDEVAMVFATTRGELAGALGLGREAREEAPGLLSRTTVLDDGSFRIPLPEGTTEGHLSVRGRYVYSLESMTVHVDTEEPIELEPVLGAWIRGKVTAAGELARGVDFEGLEARLAVDPSGSENVFDGSAWQLRTTPATAGVFEFTGVSTRDPLRVLALSASLPAATSDRLLVEPGGKYDLELVSEIGGSIRGRVLDAKGDGFPGVEVFALHDANFLAGRLGRRVREVQTDEDGGFELLGVAAGALSVRASLPDHLLVSKRLDLEAGETLEEVELVLTRGGTIAGRVVGPGGEPRANARISALFDLGKIGGMEGVYAIRGNFQETRSREDGSFEVSGLGRGPFTVTASWLPPDKQEEELEERAAARWARTARADRVAPGTKGLELRVAEPMSIDGRVTLADGGPAPQFDVRASRSSESLIAGFGTEVVQESFEQEGGDFRLWGVSAGSWEVLVSAPGHAPSVLSDLSLPRDPGAEPLEFQLEPELTISGRVLLPDGSPAQGAKVSDAGHGFERMSRAFNALEEDRSVTNGQGEFSIGGLGPGRLSLVARAKGFADSEPVELELLPGPGGDPVTLRLRAEAIITGEVYAEDGRPAVGDGVIAQIPGSLEMLQTSSDPQGRFRLEGMVPGTWQVVAIPNEDKLAGMLAEEGAGVGRMLSGMRIQVVDLKEGDEKHVLLGEPLPDPVRVFGRITIDERAVPDVVVSFVSEAGQEASVRFGSANQEGRYELSLPAAGPYVMLVQRMGQVMAETSLEYRVEIPEREEHELDVAIPLGRLSGTVLGPQGDPLSGARVSLMGEGMGSQTFWGGQFSETVTDANGVYEVDWLRAGSYRVTAGGLRYGGLFGEPSPWGRGDGRVVSVSKGEHRQGVDFRLALGGGVRGVVRDEFGTVVADAAIYVYDAEGRPVERLSFDRSDAGGEYEVRSLAPGEYSILARSALASGELSEVVLVESEKTAALDLQVAIGTLLEVEVQGPDGESLEVDVQVLDEEGRNMASVVSFQQVVQAFQSGSAQTLRRVGPLAPGRYRVVADVPGTGSADKRVTLRGRASRRIVLRLK